VCVCVVRAVYASRREGSELESVTRGAPRVLYVLATREQTCLRPRRGLYGLSKKKTRVRDKEGAFVTKERRFVRDGRDCFIATGAVVVSFS